MSTQPKTFLTSEQYLENERRAEFKSEYYCGEMFAMAGASEAHILIVANLMRDLGVQIRSRQCRLYSNDLRVAALNADFYTYPDVVGVCGKPRFADGKFDTLLNPNLLVEVLSPSNEGYDRGLKFEMYRTIESVTDYVLVSSDRIHVDLFTKRPEGLWFLTSVSNPEDSFDLQSIGCHMSVADLYSNVEFER